MNRDEAISALADPAFLDALYGFSYRRCHTTADAEDLCQDILLSVLNAIQRAAEVEQLEAFVWRIAHRVYADFCEKRQRTRTHETALEAYTGADADRMYRDAATAADFSDEVVERLAQEAQLQNILREVSFLSKLYRDTFVMYYLEEKPIGDIAQALGVSANTVKQRLFYARTKIKQEAETMEKRNLVLQPVDLSFIGMGNPVGNNPANKAERLLSGNLVYLCRREAKSAAQLAEELCVPMPFVEQEIDILLKGENGEYGLLRRQGNKVIANIIIVDGDEYTEANRLYAKHMAELSARLKAYMLQKQDAFLAVPYLSAQTDVSFIFWVLVNEVKWHLSGQVNRALTEKAFAGVERPERPYDVVAISDRGWPQGRDVRGYGNDGNGLPDYCGYRNVFIRNMYGRRMDRHFYCGQDLSRDPVFNLTVRAIGGLPLSELDDGKREIAAKAIECGFLRRVGDRLEPRIVVLDGRDLERFKGLMNEFYETLPPLCEQIADEVAAFMKKTLPAHLLCEYETYNPLIASSSVLDDLIEQAIADGLLCEPQQRIGPEGVLMVVDK